MKKIQSLSYIQGGDTIVESFLTGIVGTLADAKAGEFIDGKTIDLKKLPSKIFANCGTNILADRAFGKTTFQKILKSSITPFFNKLLAYYSDPVFSKYI